MVVILKKFGLITIDIYYYIPDYQHIVQQFIWQLTDELPNIPRTNQFIKFWKNNIGVKIKDIVIYKNEIANYRNVDYIN